MKTELNRVADEVIRLTTWKNIRRYVILGGLAFVIIDLAITLTVVIILAAHTTASDLAHARQACGNTATLAHIQRVSFRQQTQQTAALVTSGFTFGLTQAQFRKLVALNDQAQQKYLKSLDKLADDNCDL